MKKLSYYGFDFWKWFIPLFTHPQVHRSNKKATQILSQQLKVQWIESIYICLDIVW